jgi:hypothetical protein
MTTARQVLNAERHSPNAARGPVANIGQQLADVGYAKCASLFPVPYSLFPVPYSLFPVPYSLFHAQRGCA